MVNRSGWIFGLLLMFVAWNANAVQLLYKVDDVCERIADKLGSVSLADCVERDLQLTSGKSTYGIPILAKEYPPLPPRLFQARVLVIGGIHGDELSSVSIVFKWMKMLDKHHSGLFHWMVVPVLNPDGLLQKKSKRMNANGVDLNRNFPTPNWLEASTKYWVQRTGKNPRRYPGPAPLSEPESQWLAQAIDNFRPDAIVSVHAPHGVVDYDGPPEGPGRLGHLRLNLLGTYPGSLGNYAGVQRELPMITIELPRAGLMPTKAQTTRIWTDLVRWLKRNVPRRPRGIQQAAQETVPS